MPSVEPFVMDHLQLQLTGGPQGYRIHLKNMEILGASNFTVEDLKLSENGKPFEASISIPRLNIRAKYQSTGVLIIIPASGNGDFAATFDGVVVKVRGLVSFDQRADIAGTFMHVDSLDLDLVVKKVRMSVSKIFNNSKLLSTYSLLRGIKFQRPTLQLQCKLFIHFTDEATNLFLRENGNEILKAMLPQLQKKLANEFTKIGNSLLKHVPIEDFLRE